MPTSHHDQVNEVLDLIIATNPTKMLDIGVGFGKYGFLAREYLELSDGRDVYGDWTRQIDGIEGFEEYITPLQRQIYSNIHIGNVLVIIDSIETQYDLIILIDVLEHFTYEQGLVLLEKLANKSKYLIVSTPRVVTEQEDAFNNVYETHRFEWKRRHLKKYKSYAFIKNTYSHICLIGNDARKIKKKIRKEHLRIFIIARFPWLIKLYKIVRKR